MSFPDPYVPARVLCGRTSPALSPGRPLPSRVPLGQTPSLPPLRRPSRSLVRGVLRYYGPVRLPRVVHQRRASTDFPLRPGGLPLPPGNPGISRFPCEMFPNMLGVFDRAGSVRGSRYRPVRCCLPRHRRRRHPGVEKFRGSIPGLPVPLLTLRRHLAVSRRIARGRCGSLLLHRMTLAVTTSRRS